MSSITVILQQLKAKTVYHKYTYTADSIWTHPRPGVPIIISATIIGYGGNGGKGGAGYSYMVSCGGAGGEGGRAGHANQPSFLANGNIIIGFHSNPNPTSTWILDTYTNTYYQAHDGSDGDAGYSGAGATINANGEDGHHGYGTLFGEGARGGHRGISAGTIPPISGENARFFGCGGGGGGGGHVSSLTGANGGLGMKGIVILETHEWV